MESATITAQRLPAWLLVIVATVMAAAMLAAPPVAAQEETEGVTPARVAGDNRFATAAEIATLTFDSSHDAFVASGEEFPDALATSYGAGRADAPILLATERALTTPTIEALDAFDVERVFVVGGSAVLHPDFIEGELEAQGYEVIRIAGVDRVETAADMAVAWGTGPEGEVGTLEGGRTALLASAVNFPDALTAGPLAANTHFPLFLTPRDAADSLVDDRLEMLDIERVVVVGGAAAVSSDVVGHYKDLGYEVERWSGPTRLETAAVVADNARLRLGFDASLTLLARGDHFPDALAASIHGGVHTAPIVLTADPDTLGDGTERWLANRCPDIEAIRAVGGTAAVSPATLGQAVSAAEACLTVTEIITCTNADGFTVGYPAHWATNDEPIDELPPCSLFDPDPDQIRAEGMEVPADVAVFMRIEGHPAEFGAGEFEEEISREETTVEGHDAERIEVRATGEGFFPEGTLTTRWTVDLDGQRFIGGARDIGDPSYTQKVLTLDAMMDTITFEA